MMQSRVPLGIALSFLITSPLVNEIAVAIFWASFGWKVTVIYILSGVLLGVIGGLLLDVLGFDQYVADWVQNWPTRKLQLMKTILRSDIEFQLFTKKLLPP